MLKYLSTIALLIVGVFCKGETLQTLTVSSLSDTNVAGLAWVDNHGKFHKFNFTNMVAIVDLSQWSTNQAVSDVDMAGHVIYNLGALSVLGLINNTTYGSDVIESDSGQSHIYIAPDTTFGIHNGESAGFGADVNVVSDNGNIELIHQTEGTTGIAVGSSAFTPTTALHIKDTGLGSSLGFLDFLLENTDVSASPNNQARMRMQCWDASVQGTVFGAASANSGYGNLAFFINTENGDVWLMSNNGGGGTIALLRDNHIIFGGTGDDGSGIFAQFSDSVSVDYLNNNGGSYWAQGQQGVTGTMLDGSTVTGGIITHIGP